MRRATLGELVALVGCVAALALSGAAAAAANARRSRSRKPKEVTVDDFYFGPEKLTLKKGAVGQLGLVGSATPTPTTST